MFKKITYQNEREGSRRGRKILNYPITIKEMEAVRPFYKPTISLRGFPEHFPKLIDKGQKKCPACFINKKTKNEGIIWAHFTRLSCRKSKNSIKEKMRKVKYISSSLMNRNITNLENKISKIQQYRKILILYVITKTRCLNIRKSMNSYLIKWEMMLFQ